MSKAAIIAQSLKVSIQLDQIATNLFSTSKKLYAKGKINYRQYNEIYHNYYQPIIGLSSRVVMDQSVALIDDLDKYLEKIEVGTKKIKATSKKIKKAEEIFSAFAFLISIASSAATFVAAPNPASFLAVSSSLAGFLQSFQNLS